MTRFAAAIISVMIACMSLLMGSQAYADDARYTFPQQYSMSPKGVNLQTGRFISSATDLSIGNLSFTRHWGTPAWTSNKRSLGGFTNSSGNWVQSWTHSFNQGVTWTGGNQAQAYVTVDGQTYSFIAVGNQWGPTDQETNGANLGLVSGQWVFTNQSGTVYTFYAHPAIDQGGSSSLQQVLQSVVGGDGSRIDYTYNASGQPKFVRNNRGYAIALDYDGNGNVSMVCGFNLSQVYADASSTCASSTLKVSYAYDSAGRNLTSVTDLLGRVVTIGYIATQNAQGYLISCISLANSGTCEIANTYGAAPGAINNFDDQVLTQTTATGAVWSFSYDPQPDPQDVPVVKGQPRYSRSHMIDPAGLETDLKYDRGHLVEQYAPGVAREYRYPYRLLSCCGPNPVYYEYFDVHPGLSFDVIGTNRLYVAHDNRNNVVQSAHWQVGNDNPASTGDSTQDKCCITAYPVTSPSGSAVYTQTFLADAGFTNSFGNVFVVGCGAGLADASLCDKPMTRTDANGHETDYTYEQATGLVLTETSPADPNGVRPQTRYTYSPRYAWLAAVGGGYAQASTPVWLLTQKSTCRAGAASGAGCATAGDEVRTLYDYGPDSGPNNLLLRGTVDDATGAAIRTCYGYDVRGNKISETKPRAGLGSCS